jgi:membrane fusion protein, multidrug efflux system
MTRRAWIASAVLIAAVLAAGGSLAAWKWTSLQREYALAASQPEPAESVSAAVATQRAYRPTTTTIGTIMALRSITLRNEIPGTVREVRFAPGQVVDAGTVLVALDVSVEDAELRAQQAQALLAETSFRRAQTLSQQRWVADAELDRTRAERDVAQAEIARIEAIIRRKTIRAPFRARVGIADVHPGQYLEEGAVLTTLQGVDRAVHVDFSVAQQTALSLREGDVVEVFAHPADPAPIPARIVALDARIDPATRNAAVRALIDDASRAPPPGASVRVRVPVGPSRDGVVVPADALRKGPGGDFVYVLADEAGGRLRAFARSVEVGAALGDEVVLFGGLAPGERVATSGSFKLREASLVAIAGEASPEAHAVR